MKICDRIQQSIAEKGLEFVERSGAAREHLQSCAQCTQFLKSFTELQSGIEQLPEHDAPDALVEQTLQDVANAGAPERKSARTKTRRSRLAPAMASATVILAMLGSTYHLVVPVDRAETKPPAARVAPGPGEFEDKEVAPINEIVEEQVMQDGDRVAASGGIVPKSKVEATEQESARRRAGLTGQSRANESLADEKSLARNYDLYGMVLAPEEPAARNQPGSEPPTVRESGAGTALEDHRLDLALLAQVDAPARNDGRLSEQIAKHGARSQLQPLEAAEVDKRDIGLSAGDDTIDILDRAADLNSRLEITVEPDPATEPESAARAGGKPPGQSRGAIAPAMPPQSNPAKRFLTELERREGLAFQPATGYWANTYVPGDPAMRLLQARLASWDRGAMKLDTAAQPIWQPFDLPVSAALGVHLQA
ncbi:MAG: hypothetical protein ACR2RB_03720, partial [Gammaproteobacteria bacterium]